MAQIDVYVDPDAGGGGTGVDWANAYTSLNAAEANEQDDYATNGDNIVYHCRSGSGTMDTIAVTIDGSNTTATENIEIINEDDNSGKWDATVYTVQAGNGATFVVSDAYVKLKGLQIELTGMSANYQQVLYSVSVPNGTEVLVDSCLMKSANDATYRERAVGQANGTAELKLKNCLIWNVGTTVAHPGNSAAMSNGGSMFLHDCTISGGYNNAQYVAGTMQAINSIFCNASNSVAGTWGGSTDYNVSDQADVPDAGGGHSKSGQAFTFVNAAAGDFHLQAGDTGAQDNGVDISGDGDLPVSVDIDGDARGDPPDCGIDEYIAAGGNVPFGDIRGQGLYGCFRGGI